jgi:mannose-6-phosphate isomerase-like protein (cupin superfamily)
MAFRAARLDELDRIAVAGTIFRPVRRTLGVSAFGVNAYTADRAGDELIEPHDETSAGSAKHEELYVVVAGRATFTVDGEQVDAPAGALVLVPPGVKREAVASADDTSVVVVGGPPGAAGPISPFEYWYAATPAYDQGDYARAYEIAAEGLDHHPENGTLHYNLACYAALAGERDAALRHLRTAFDNDPRTRGFADEDGDLDSIRAEFAK